MPVYGTQTPPALFPFHPQDQFTLFNAEALTTSEYSQQVHIPPGPVGAILGIVIDGDFNAAPGAFEFDIFEAQIDTLGTAGYSAVPTGGVINAVDTGPNALHFHADLNPFQGKFCLIFVKTKPANANITCTLRITRT